MPRKMLAGTEQPFVQHLMELRDRLIKAYCRRCGGCVAGFLPRARRRCTTCWLRLWWLPFAQGCHADRHLGDFAFHGAAQDFADGGLHAGFAGGAVAGVGLCGAGPVPHEKKLVLPLVASSTLLFFVGVAFCYFFVFGQAFQVHSEICPKSITAAPDIEAYLGFVLTMFIAFGMAFEVPIVVVCWPAWAW
jgi:sec-independent protein translocase protein TatC